jgi:DNA polymerase-3 subunit alpha
MAALPLDDERTYELLKRAETVGVFQLESGGMRDLIRKAEPGNIEDIIALVALYRPGPMENIPKYIASQDGRGSAGIPA